MLIMASMPMNNLTPADNGLHVIPSTEPAPRLVQDAVPAGQEFRLSPIRTQEQFSSFSTLSFVGGFILLVLIAVVAWNYLVSQQQPHREAALADRPLHNHQYPTPGADLPDRQSASANDVAGRPASPLAAPSNGASTPTGQTALLPITPDNLRVTSIALGDVHLAIVNGRRVGEGDRLPFTVGGNHVTLHVDKIEDRLVHFTYGTQAIDVKLTPILKTKPPGQL